MSSGSAHTTKGVLWIELFRTVWMGEVHAHDRTGPVAVSKAEGQGFFGEDVGCLWGPPNVCNCLTILRSVSKAGKKTFGLSTSFKFLGHTLTPLIMFPCSALGRWTRRFRFSSSLEAAGGLSHWCFGGVPLATAPRREPAATLRLTAARRACLSSKTVTKEEIPTEASRDSAKKMLRVCEYRHFPHVC